MPHVLLGITGSIAAYKTPELIRLCQQHAFTVSPIVTKSAFQFVTKCALETVSEQCVYEDSHTFKSPIPHIHLAKSGDLLIVAPATANIIAKFAHGLADECLSSLFLEYSGQKLIVPAMHSDMFSNPITQENILKLKSLGVHFLGPDKGDLACGDTGIGRMVEPDLIVKKILSMMYPPLNLKGKKILITAGGTQEPIDTVRVISNRSTGKLGTWLSHFAAFFGAEVTLISTFPEEKNPEIHTTVPVKTVNELQEKINLFFPTHNVLYMAAAVSDFTVTPSSKKINRGSSISLPLTPTPDLLKMISSHKKKDQIIIGFCLEEDNLIEKARKKLKNKDADFMIANTSASIGQEIRTLYILSKKNSHVLTLENRSLPDIAYNLLKLIV